MSENAPPLQYGGFWVRFAAFWLDALILLPVTGLAFWGSEQYRLYPVYSFVPNTLLSLFYSVYLVKRFGGTPGKLIMRLRIRKVTGEPVGYREALLRYAPEFLLSMPVTIALLSALFQLTDAEYHALPFMERSQRVINLAPGWYRPAELLLQAWILSEFIVMLTNAKRRALHDFIAGTVVVREST